MSEVLHEAYPGSSSIIGKSMGFHVCGSCHGDSFETRLRSRYRLWHDIHRSASYTVQQAQRPTTIQTWPGKMSTELANKNKTAVAFQQQTGSCFAWGFQCEELQDNGHHTRDVRIEEFFKLHLDPDYVDTHESAPNPREAQSWFCNYMCFLYTFVQGYFTERFPRWNHNTVEFLFSIPTTWKNPAMVAQIEKILRSAGFGMAANQKIKISLTEAEAAAVYVANQHYNRDDVILVCDAGGGTTDVNILKVASIGTRTELTPLCHVDGIAIGSALIDWRMSLNIEERLELVKYLLGSTPHELAEQMIRGRFETFKCDFGSPASDMEEYPLPIPGMRPGYDFPGSRIRNSSIILNREELKQLFDEQIDKILMLIDKQLDRLYQSRPHEVVSYLVVSGGLGSSPYLRQRLRERYQAGAANHHPNVEDIQILLAPEPQLAVCHGLVMNRVQEITSDRLVYTSRCCRANYGIVCRERYDPRRHVSEDVILDPHDKKKWVDGQIHWVIKKGDSIAVRRGIRHPYRLKRALGTERAPWRTQIVMSALPPDQLPSSLKQQKGQPHSVSSVCTIESSLEHADMQRKNARWYHWAREYWLAEFEMRILLGPADLRFQLWGKDGQRLDREERDVAVEWEVVERRRTVDVVEGEGEVAGVYRA
ncbi:hypothetical protein MPH_04768 [Macrophomina phaseolina MS6]|uniref:Heat shock protein Hsp70 n=1 Tax=Macrophomina phaseolina (strain MS6) TaxID=1126212 RepID=K2RTL2_MACPH|nr:hypothetical protein MPH_04768 [Macrophomina phaseolina MS6]